ncbi:MAG: glycerophosphodiester phosphodiesterase [Pseudomonadota bacterium]
MGAPAFWPYPKWIAHRGAGKQAPENTLVAFKLGASHGYRMFECDVKLSADDVLFLLHDATLDRTSNGKGDARALDWAALSKLDAGGWHSTEFTGEPLASLDVIARYCLDHDYFLNIEIKPTPGLEGPTGTAVANAAAAMWAASQTPPLLSSFQPAALEAARRAQPQLPRALLLDTLNPGWLDTARELDCVAVVCNYRLWNEVTVRQAQQADLRTLCYTANESSAVQAMLALGLDGIITDEVHVFRPDTTN